MNTKLVGLGLETSLHKKKLLATKLQTRYECDVTGSSMASNMLDVYNSYYFMVVILKKHTEHLR